MNAAKWIIAIAFACLTTSLALGMAVSALGGLQNASAVYKSKCAVCHASDGSGTAVGQNLGVKSFGSTEARQNAFNWFGIIKDGKGKMPAYRHQFDTDRIVELLAYIRAFPITAAPGVNGYPMLDENHVYTRGQKIELENPHGAYYGWTLIDSHYYFLRPLHISETERKQKPELISVGTISASVRVATSPKWRKVTFSYTCEDLLLRVGRIELALGDEKELSIGSHNAICSLKPRSPEHSKHARPL